jgi:hypothetical protein
VGTIDSPVFARRSVGIDGLEAPSCGISGEMGMSAWWSVSSERATRMVVEEVNARYISCAWCRRMSRPVLRNNQAVTSRT